MGSSDCIEHCGTAVRAERTDECRKFAELPSSADSLTGWT